MKRIIISKFIKILLTLLFLLILETIIIFMLIEKDKVNNIHRDIPSHNPKIPLTLVMNISSSRLEFFKGNTSQISI
ncbi:MAG: hypothetical protein H7Y18_01220 [Clostridiaceae bacterium]|nr:hypothetical protein [Clostridiaceae bacterium]